VIVSIELRTCFSLPDPDPKKSYSVARWGSAPSNKKGISGAKITCATANITAATNKYGNPLDLRFPADNLGRHTLSIAPKKGMESATPAGVKMGSGKNDPDLMFRPFDIEVEIDSNGLVASKPPRVNLTCQPKGTAPYAVIFGTPTAHSIVVDWKPDWMAANAKRHKARPKNASVSCLVLHATGGDIIGRAIDEFTSSPKGVSGSAHYVVDKDGHTLKMIHESSEAYHAGPGFWQGHTNVNSFSVGVEIVHYDDNQGSAFPQAQMDAVVRLATEIRSSFKIVRQRVVGHSDVELSPGSHLIGNRKELDPGLWFAWDSKWSRTPSPVKPEDVHDGPGPSSIYGFVLGAGPVQPNIASGKPRGPQILALKADLSSIGYSVSAKDGMPHTDQFDDGLLRAIFRFKSHYGPRQMSASDFNKTKHHLSYELGLLIKQVLADTKP
jgi:N-acetyl-anhydromuramyl-L-alanine amidase AmpD